MTVVVKLGGRVQSDPNLGTAVRELWESSGNALCIVHGGGDEVTALQRQLGREPTFINGRRVTTDYDVDLVRMVLSGSANKRLVASLTSSGLPAAGVSGEDGGLLPAEPIDPGTFGRAGKPVIPQTRIIEVLLSGGFLPVISPVASDASSPGGGALNVNGDDAAGAIAAALKADLWMIADVQGVLDENGALIPQLDDSQMQALVDAGTVNRGMFAKLEAGFTALQRGSPTVRIASIEAFSSDSSGTFLSLTPSLK